MTFEMNQAPLGKKSAYIDNLDTSLLFPVPRQLKRDEIQVPSKLPFKGVDYWNAFEVSWLNAKGKPQVAIAEITTDCQSPNLIESKSLKLYFNSYNQTHFETVEAVQKQIEVDLSQVAQYPVRVQIILPNAFNDQVMAELDAVCIDDLDIEIETYHTSPDFLKRTDKKVKETLCSHLLKSNCLITEQPDWGSVLIKYEGYQIDHEGLLKYIVSFRQHNEFHEQCVERIFMDIMKYCQPEMLTVYARYTRRGGLDINPFRSNFETPYPNVRNARQ